MKIFRTPYPFIVFFLILAYLFFRPSGPKDGIGMGDKVAHCMAFSVLTSTLVLWINRYKIPIILMMIYGVLIEVVQDNLPKGFDRSFELMDIFADYSGILFGMIVTWAVEKALPPK
ncbi:MAG: VanZ family protein [Leadbetterella sp.]